MELFDLLNTMFKDPISYKNDVTKLDKRKHFFMINRRLAIAHPAQANVLNHLKINFEEAIDIWQLFLQKQYRGKIPGWIYTKGVKKVKDEQEQKLNIPTKDMVEFANINKYDLKSVKDAAKFFPDILKKEITKLLNVQNGTSD